MGSKRLYEYINNNPFFEFYPTEYVQRRQHYQASTKNGRASRRSWKFDPPTGNARTRWDGPVLQRHRRQVGFIFGARREAGGQGYNCYASTPRPAASRGMFVPHLTRGAAGSCRTRAMFIYVVTEYGVAYLHGRASAAAGRARPDKYRAIRTSFRTGADAGGQERKNYIYQDQISWCSDEVSYPRNCEPYSTSAGRDGDILQARSSRLIEPAPIGDMYSF